MAKQMKSFYRKKILTNPYKPKEQLLIRLLSMAQWPGGAIVIINEENQHSHLDFLYVKHGEQSKSIGKQMWDEIERLHPKTNVWETCTPYFEKRNIHFYVNKCGFHIVEFWNEKHPDPNMPEDYIGDGSEGMFRFQKKCRTF